MRYKRILNQKQRSGAENLIEGYFREAERLRKEGKAEAAGQFLKILEPSIEELKLAIEQFDKAASGKLEPTIIGEHPGPYLVSMRIASGLTQEQLADKLGCSQPAVHKYEAREYRGCPHELLVKVERALSAKKEKV